MVPCLERSRTPMLSRAFHLWRYFPVQVLEGLGNIAQQVGN